MEYFSHIRQIGETKMANILQRGLLKLKLLHIEKVYNVFRENKYVDRMVDIFDYHTAIKFRPDPYWQRGWYNGKAEGYGIGTVYRRFSGYKGELNCSFEHSLAFSRTNNESEYRDIKYPVIITSSSYRWNIIQPLTDKLVIPCGCFFMPYAESIYDDFMTGVIKKNLGKTLLVFPQFNNINSFYEGEEEKKLAFYDQVDQMKKEHGFKTVIVCSFYADVLNQSFREYEERGWIVVSAGRGTNYDFGDNMKTILSLADHVVVQNSISSVVQAVYMKKPTTYVMGRTSKKMADGRISVMGAELGFTERYQECYDLFGEYAEEISDVQYEWCNRWGGFDDEKSHEEIKLLMDFAHKLGKGNITDSRVRHIVNKKKYEPIRQYIEEALSLRLKK